jgi:tRNA(fMet)-specific endonuclease VapC
MKFLLDTDTFSELARMRNPVLSARLAKHSLTEMAVSVITVGELRFGVQGETLPAVVLTRTESLLAEIACLPLDAAVAEAYGQVRASLRKLGAPIGPNDNWIAAHALAAGLILVTGNTREYKRVVGLRTENWLR